MESCSWVTDGGSVSWRLWRGLFLAPAAGGGEVARRSRDGEGALRTGDLLEVGCYFANRMAALHHPLTLPSPPSAIGERKGGKLPNLPAIHPAAAATARPIQ